jgi:hypothetical protein
VLRDAHGNFLSRLAKDDEEGSTYGAETPLKKSQEIDLSGNQPTTAQTLPPSAQLIQMSTAYWISRIVYAAAKLELADHLAEGPKSAQELAGPMLLDARPLYRLMRTLASLGLLTERSDHRFALTSLGEALKKGAPGSALASVLTLGSSWFGSTFEDIVYSIQTGKTVFEKTHGMHAFDYLAQHPEEASLFSETMVGFHGAEPSAVAAAYDFSAFKTVVDVGGATGNLLAAILTRHAGPRGILFDRPHVVGEAPVLLEARGVMNRVTIEAGDFFKTVPDGGDAYILSHVIHDWSEDQCLTILGNCRKAMKSSSRLLIVEMVLPAGDAPHPGKLLDIVMLVLSGGQERTAAEYGSLLSKVGFRLTRTVQTDSEVSVVEAMLT